MPEYIQHKDLDKAQWDKCISRAFNGIVYAYSWFLDTVSPGWDALVENDYERVFPLTWKKKYGVYYLHQPFFTQQLGIFSMSILTPDIVRRFLEGIPEKFRLTEINLNTLNKVEPNGFEVEKQINHELDLIKSYPVLKKNYSTNTRRNLKKAEASGLTVMKNQRPEDVIRLFRENRGRNLSHLHDEDYLRLTRLIYAGIHRGLISIYGAFSERNELCAAAVFLTSNRKSVFLFSGLSGEGRDKRAMFLLVDRFIRDHAQKHLVFDFDGSNDPNLSRFYKGFGSTECHYYKIRRNTLPFMVNLAWKLKQRKRDE